jgi:general secretion pathway protein J
MTRRSQQGFTLVWRSAEHGFILVELVVALFIFALISAGGVSLLGYSVGVQAAAGERLDDVAAIRRVGALLTADLAQATPRISRDAEGRQQVAFEGGTGAPGEVALAFVRRGWSNEAGEARSSLQKVEYRLKDGVLLRRTWPMVDGSEARPPAPVLKGVRSLVLRYRIGGEWRERWDSKRPDALPKAVEAVIDVDGTGPVRQLFLTGTGY